MSNYAKTVDFAAKDALASGDPAKIAKGTEVNTEFVNIATAITSKADSANPAFSGTASGTLNVPDIVFSVVGSADATKKLAFEVDGNTAGQTRVATPPDYNFRVMSQTHGADVASAGTVNLDTATGDLVDVTGTTTITAITLADGKMAVVRFTGILTLTNGASLVLPTGANITTAVGDFATFRGYAAGVVRCSHYERANGLPLNTFVAPSVTILSGSGNHTVPAGVYKYKVTVIGGGGGSGGSANDQSAGGGGGGAAIKWLTVAPGDVIAYAVGAGGAAGTSAPGAGGTGGTSTFGAITATGGVGSAIGTTAILAGGAPGAGSAGDINLTGGYGGVSDPTGNVSGTGGSSLLSGEAGARIAAANGVVGSFPGGGGGGTFGAGGTAGAAGGAGTIILEY